MEHQRPTRAEVFDEARSDKDQRVSASTLGRKRPPNTSRPSATILAVAEYPDDDSSNVIAADFSCLRARPEEILIPQYDIRGAMGHGQVPADYNEAIRNLIVREDVLREKGVTYTSAAALALITGWGQSREGTINDKDPVIVDRGVNEFCGGRRLHAHLARAALHQALADGR
ncbi:hypothetical protein D3C85_1183920 [compost metagenome]